MTRARAPIRSIRFELLIVARRDAAGAQESRPQVVFTTAIQLSRRFRIRMHFPGALAFFRQLLLDCHRLAIAEIETLLWPPEMIAIGMEMKQLLVAPRRRHRLKPNHPAQRAAVQVGSVALQLAN